ncbi:MAG: Crp/Fnr family transcriptional regulator [Cyanobacteriota bacterium]|nr:Crp/Fnr family transcriptional regulator [Cyanobacteriota bacterium]
MVFTPSREAGSSDAFRQLLESSYQRRSLIHLAAGSQVPLLRNNVWLVVRGMVKLGAITIHGDELLLGLAGPNEPFGEPLSGVDAFEARTLCDSDFLCLTMAEIKADPALSAAMLQALAQRYRQSQALLGLMALRRVEERVRGFLELIASDYGQPCEQGLRLNLRLTHQEVASALATTRVTVTRVIGALKEEGWLRIDSQRRLVVSHLPRP